MNPNGGEVTSCQFDYGTSEAYGKSAPCSALPGSGSTPVAVSAAAVGLSADTTYRFRVVATNSGGASKGVAETFETLPDPPTVVTKAASSVSQTSALLNATVNPNGGTVTGCHFDYGTTIGYGHEVPCSSLPGSGAGPVDVSASVIGLSANTTYHFRIVAENTGGPSSGVDQTFPTLPTPSRRDGRSLLDRPDLGDAERDGEPQRRGSRRRRMQARIRHHDRLRARPALLLPGSGTSALAVSATAPDLEREHHLSLPGRRRKRRRGESGSDQTFKTLPNPPTVVTEKASSIAQTTATLNATVNPNGGSVGACKLEYGTSTSYGSSASCTASPGSGSSAVAVSAVVTGLSANTTYHFRVVATNAGGTATGGDEAFDTLPNPPTVATGSGSSVMQTSATLNATVNPNGGEISSCYFEYGESASYGDRAPCTASPGSGAGPVAVSAPVTGLIKNTTYHFRIVATNTGGNSPGDDQTLETAPGPPTVIAGAPSAIGQTSVVLNAEINPNGGVVTQCYFHYERLTAKPEVIVTPCVGLPLSGKSPVKVSALAEGLSANTRYSFSLEVINSLGEDSFDEGGAPFETLPGPRSRHGRGVVGHTDLGDTQRDGESQRWGSEQLRVRIWHVGIVRVHTSSLRIAGGSGQGRCAGIRQATGSQCQHEVFFRIVATNPGGTSKDTLGQTLTTLPIAPAVVTGEASSVTQTSVSVNATVNENGGQSSACDFEYGPTASAYGTSVPCASSPGSGTDPVAVSAVLASLTPNTTYHVRMVAANPGGTGTGEDPDVYDGADAQLS